MTQAPLEGLLARPQGPLDFRRFERRFLLVTNLPCFSGDDGKLYVDRAWHHDLTQHTTYLHHLTLATPLVPRTPDIKDLVELVPEEYPGFRYLALPPQTSTPEAVRVMPRTADLLWNAIREADVVQANIAGWPYPLGWLAIPMARMQEKKVFVVVESAPWRPSGAAIDKRLTTRVRAAVYEVLARAFCRTADLSAYTQPSYRDTLHTGDGRGPAYVTPATWINDEVILDQDVAEGLWADKRKQPARFLFAARLMENKGVNVLLDALRQLEVRGVRVDVDVIGAGDLRDAVVAASQELRTVKLRMLDPVPYGPEFFALVDRYHGMLVPILSDEQPRIVFDAAARAVPVIASDADGIRPHVQNGKDGVLVPRGDVGALARALERAAGDVESLARMGLTALDDARPHTHRAMHALRSQLLAALDGEAQAPTQPQMA
jgi:glycosyltransferase involved in cell wall biosynthesis